MVSSGQVLISIYIHLPFILGFTTLFLVFPVMISKDKDADFEALMSSDSRATQFKARLVQNPYYQEVIKRALPLMDRKGLLDPM